MTINSGFVAATDAYSALGISPVADAPSIHNSLGRPQSIPTASVTRAIQPGLDSADFSETGVLVAAALSDADLRTERIATLRQSIANGTYRVSATTVADSIIKATLAGL